MTKEKIESISNRLNLISSVLEDIFNPKSESDLFKSIHKAVRVCEKAKQEITETRVFDYIKAKEEIDKKLKNRRKEQNKQKDKVLQLESELQRILAINTELKVDKEILEKEIKNLKEWQGARSNRQEWWETDKSTRAKLNELNRLNEIYRERIEVLKEQIKSSQKEWIDFSYKKPKKMEKVLITGDCINGNTALAIWLGDYFVLDGTYQVIQDNPKQWREL